MNIFKKMYCRLSQGVFKLIMPLLPYRDPEIKRSVADIPAVIKERGLARPLIVTDAFLAGSGVLDNTKAALDGAGISYSVFKDTVPNPTTATVDAALEMYKQGGCDCLVAFGGGSPIDTAKAVGACVARPGKPLGKMKGVLGVGKAIPFLAAVPTTCGTGSETTLAAVIVDENTRIKYAINDFPLIPRVAVLDPEVLSGLPAKLVAYTGLDALTHAVEAYIGRGGTKRTNADSLAAIKLIFQNIEPAAAGDMAARAAMLEASFLAGRAFTRAYVGYVHALAHALGGKYNVAHGLANAVLLPAVLDGFGKKIHKKLANAARYAGLAKEDCSAEEGAASFMSALRSVEERLGVPTGFDCIDEADIPVLAKTADKEANPLYPVPVLWGADELASIYKKVRLS